VIGGKGLGDEIMDALFQRGDRHGHVAVARHEDHRNFGVDRRDPLRQLDAVNAGHPDVGHDHTGKVRRDGRQRGERIAMRLDVDPGQFE